VASVFLVEWIALPIAHDFAPRSVGVAVYSAWITGGIYLATAGVGVFCQRRRTKSVSINVPALPFVSALVATIGMALLLSIAGFFG